MEQTVQTSGTLQLEPWQKWAMDPNTPPGNPWRDLESFVDVRTGVLWL